MEQEPRVVLSVDDNDVDGALLERAFKRTAVPSRLFRVSEGPQALAYLSGEGIYQDRGSYPVPDLVLLDLAMPKMSGLEVLKWIRRQPDIQRTRVLIFTASEKPEDVQAATSIGADSYLIKPTKFEDLKALVKQVHEEWLGPKKKGRAKKAKAEGSSEGSAESRPPAPGGSPAGQAILTSV